MTAKELYDEICSQFGGFRLDEIPDDADCFALEFGDETEDQICKIYNKYKDNQEVEMKVVANWIEKQDGLLIADYDVDYDLEKEEPVIDIMTYDGVHDRQGWIHILTEVDKYKEAAMSDLDDWISCLEDEYDEWDEDSLNSSYDEYKETIEKNYEYIKNNWKAGQVLVISNDPWDSEYDVELAPRYATNYDYCGISSQMFILFKMK